MLEKDYLEAVSHFLREIDPDCAPNFSREALEANGMNRKPLDFFRKHCSHMSASELIALFRGLVLTEKHMRLLGGSVASNIWLLRILSERLEPADTYKEIAWALENRGDNPYTPLGSLGGDRLFNEFGREVLTHCKSNYLSCFAFKISMLEAEKRRMREIAEEQNKIAKQQERIQVQEARHKESVARATYLKSEIKKLNGMTCAERLSWLVKSNLPIPAIPIDYFQIDFVKANYDGQPPLDLIVTRLKGHKKHWSKLVSELEESKGEAL